MEIRFGVACRALLVGLVLSTVASAGTCSDTLLSNVLGTTCTDGKATFTFSSYSIFGANNTNVLAPNQIDVNFSNTGNDPKFTLQASFSLVKQDSELPFSDASILLGYTVSALGDRYARLTETKSSASGVTIGGDQALVTGELCTDPSCLPWSWITAWSEEAENGVVLGETSSSAGNGQLGPSSITGYASLYYGTDSFSGYVSLLSLSESYVVSEVTPEPATVVLLPGS
jgi:hypothetical protein